MNVLANVGDEMAERIAAKNGGADPKDSAEGIEEQIAGIGHSGGTRDRRTERPNDGDKARQNHGTAAIFFVEGMRALQVAPAEKEGILAAVEGGSRGTANPIADLIARNSAEHNWQQKPLEGDYACVGEDASGDQKRVTREKKSDKEAGLYKDDKANEGSASGAD